MRLREREVYIPRAPGEMSEANETSRAQDTGDCDQHSYPNQGERQKGRQP